MSSQRTVRRRLTLVALGAAATALAAGPDPTFFDPQRFDHTDLGVIGPYTVAAADMDGDGVRDLVAVPFWYRGLGDGTFETTRRGAYVPLVGAYANVVDLDADGDGDLFFAATNGTVRDYVGVSLYRNTGDGTLVQVPIPDYADDVNTRGGGCTFDLGDDGDLDIASLLVLDAPSYQRVVEIIENRGAEGFVRTQRIPLGQIGGTPKAADMNGDGRDDLILDGGTRFTVCLQQEDGTLQPLTPVSYNGAAQYDKAVLADFDADGDIDVFAGDLVLRNDGHGVLVPDPITAPNGRALLKITANQYAAGDIDNDGWVDFVGQADAGGDVAWLRNDHGSFEGAVPQSLGIETRGARALALADVDGNGRLDFLVSASSLARVTVARQSGASPPSAAAVSPDVIDRPGAYDLVVAGDDFTAGATADLGVDVTVESVTVESPQSARAHVMVPPAIGGGLRTLAVVNPDGQRTSRGVEFRSVDATLRSGRLRATPAPARDVLRLRGSLASNELSEYDAFVAPTEGLHLGFGRGAEQFVLDVPAGDPRWTSRRGGRALRFETAPDEFPRVRLDVRARDARFTLRVSFADVPADSAGPVELRYAAASDIGADDAAWESPRRGRTLRLRRSAR